MPEYRSPEEEQIQQQIRARIDAILDQAVHDGASLKVAMVLGEDQDVVDRWTDALYDGLRDGLSDDHPVDGDGFTQEDRLAAITMLLEERMNAETRAVLAGLRKAGGGAPC